MCTFIDLRLVNMSKSIQDPLKKLRLGTFTNMNKKVKVKGREVQFSSQSDIFGKIALIAQARSVDLQEIFNLPIGVSSIYSCIIYLFICTLFIVDNH